MKILSIREQTVSLGSEITNATMSFAAMTASAVVIEVETGGAKFQGLGFSSYGRYGHGGLLKERFIPRLLDAEPDDFVDKASDTFSMSQFWNVLMKDEKEGGHGERSGAVGVLETAMWDALSKSEGMPLWGLLERDVGHATDEGTPAGQTVVYSSGGHYRAGDADTADIAKEARNSLESGYAWFKLKVGGRSRSEDNARLEAAIRAAGNPQLIAVDANCAFGSAHSAARIEEIDQFNVRWIEEPVDPLDFESLAVAVKTVKTPIATGENIFSKADAMNLMRYGGLRPGRDLLQMDIILSYGIMEFLRIVEVSETMGWTRRDFFPHAGHQLALHVSAGLGLGGHETASTKSFPFSGLSDDTKIEDGIASLSDVPGIGIESKPALYRYFDGILD